MVAPLPWTRSAAGGFRPVWELLKKHDFHTNIFSIRDQIGSAQPPVVLGRCWTRLESTTFIPTSHQFGIGSAQSSHRWFWVGFGAARKASLPHQHLINSGPDRPRSSAGGFDVHLRAPGWWFTTARSSDIEAALARRAPAAGGHTGDMAERPDRYRTQSVLPANQLACLLYTSPSPRDATLSRMPSSA